MVSPRSRLGLGRPVLALVTALSTVAALTLVCADGRPTVSDGTSISGPYGRMLAQSIYVGAAPFSSVHVTAALYDRAEPVRLSGWARAHGLSVRWRAGDDWAVIDGAPGLVADALGVAVRGYRIRGGPDAGRVY